MNIYKRIQVVKKYRGEIEKRRKEKKAVVVTERWQ